MEIIEISQVLHWEAAHEAVRAATRQAEQLGIRIQAAVTDRAGLLLAFLGMHGAPLHSATIAEDKAYTAASFGLATGAWGGVVGENEPLARGLAARPRLVMFGGGLPVLVDEKCVGGLGVSGGSEAEDEACARAALEAIQSAASCSKTQ